MEILIILKVFLVFIVALMTFYSIYYYLITWNRLFKKQKIAYGDIYDSEMPTVSVLIPMHNEEKVLNNVISALLKSDYDKNKLEIIAINDHSTDSTAEMLDYWVNKSSQVKALHRVEDNQNRGKPVSLNDGLDLANGEVILIFDADYYPSVNIVRKLVLALKDPSVGVVMGRVIPYNSSKNVLTKSITLERIGGYQCSQQGKYNKSLIVQYGGTVGGFRKELIKDVGNFNPEILAEDTDLTIRTYLNGYKIVYDNSAECYEEVPETWASRANQLRRWSRGHNSVLFKYFCKTISCEYLSISQKIDGIALLFIYMVPFLFLISIVCCLILFFAGEMSIYDSWVVLCFIGFYNTYGNFAPFYQIASAGIIDGVGNLLVRLPMLAVLFYYNMWYVSLGFIDAVIDLILSRNPKWNKTDRYREDISEL